MGVGGFSFCLLIPLGTGKLADKEEKGMTREKAAFTAWE